MRQKRTIQSSLFDIFAGHQIGVELKVMSALLDGAGSAVLDLPHRWVAAGRDIVPRLIGCLLAVRASHVDVG
jgi:hypothetical protein